MKCPVCGRPESQGRGTCSPEHFDTVSRRCGGAGMIIVSPGGHVLLCQTVNGGLELPGGRRGHGEPVSATARRESWEETGLCLTPQTGYLLDESPRHIGETFDSRLYYVTYIVKLEALDRAMARRMTYAAHKRSDASMMRQYCEMKGYRLVDPRLTDSIPELRLRDRLAIQGSLQKIKQVQLGTRSLELAGAYNGNLLGLTLIPAELISTASRLQELDTGQLGGLEAQPHSPMLVCHNLVEEVLIDTDTPAHTA